MLKKLTKHDYIFFGLFVCVIFFHLSCIKSLVPYDDEFLYPAGVLRFINGDIMMQHEWHLSQFFVIFSYLPVLSWINIVGSTEGIIIFLRSFYLFLHSFSVILIYLVFRNYKKYAVVAAILFFIHVPYRMYAISYITMLVFFLLLFELCLFLIVKKENCKALYVFAGIFYASCCVCNPFLCILYPVYLISCFLVQHIKKKSAENCESVTRKRLSEVNFSDMCFEKFFARMPVVIFSLGIFIMMVICVLFFFSTGATLSTFFENIGNLLSAAEYDVFNSFWEKIKETADIYIKLSLWAPFVLPCLYLALFFDKKREKHKLVYIVIALLITLTCTVASIIIFLDGIDVAYIVAVPFCVFSSVCYMLTKKKNKLMFVCLWFPSVIFSIIQYLATNTVFTASSAVLSVANIASVFFVFDFCKEFADNNKAYNKKNALKNKNKNILLNIIICFVFCLQFFFSAFMQGVDRIRDYENDIEVENGPLMGMYLDKNYYGIYEKSLDDLDMIKNISQEEDPVLIVSRMGWMCLYIDRPYASYGVELFSPNNDTLKHYYELNPEKIPKYVYVPFAYMFYGIGRNYAENALKDMRRIFIAEKQELSNGFLLSVEGLK